MSIYASSRVLPYVYKLTHKETGQFYFGYREANQVPSTEDLGKKYFTSSTTIKRLGFDNFDKEIVAEFFCGDAAYEFENETIKENISNKLCLNKHYCKDRLKHFRNNKSHSAETRKKISDSLNAIPKDIKDAMRAHNSQMKKNRSPEEKLATYLKFDATRNGRIFGAKDWVITFEDGSPSITVKNFKLWCSENQINYAKVCSYSKLDKFCLGLKAHRIS